MFGVCKDDNRSRFAIKRNELGQRPTIVARDGLIILRFENSAGVSGVGSRNGRFEQQKARHRFGFFTSDRFNRRQVLPIFRNANQNISQEGKPGSRRPRIRPGGGGLYGEDLLLNLFRPHGGSSCYFGHSRLKRCGVTEFCRYPSKLENRSQIARSLSQD